MTRTGLTRLRRVRSRSSGATTHRRWSGGLLFGVLAVLAAAVTQCTGGPLTMRRTDLKVLVLDSGGPGVAAIVEALKSQGVPYDQIRATDAPPARPIIDTAFLSSTSGTNPVIDRAKYQAVVSETESVAGLTDAERTDLFAFESKYGVRHVDAYSIPGPAVGMDFLGTGGSLDGATLTVTPAGLTAPFGYLSGSVPVDVSSAYLLNATPAAAPVAGTTFTSLVTAPAPGSPGATATVLGVYQHDGREEMVSTAVHYSLASQARVLGKGIVAWMTKGVHLGYDRNYLTVHIDDLFAADARWNSTANCTPTEDCPSGVTGGPDIRMTTADMSAVVAWQQANGFKFDWAYNGFGSVDYATEHGGSDPLLTAAKANVGAFYWLNHTYTHLFLGCQQDFTVIPWRCQTDAGGQPVWVPASTVQSEITQNITFATTNGLPIDPTELLTGEHSGLFILPQQPVDNPNLAPVFTSLGIKVTGSDASRDPGARQVGSALTVPRYPMTNYYNVGTKAEMADEFNWIHTSTADGGGGSCALDPATRTCLTPIDVTTGYDSFIVPFDTGQTLRHILNNDPRPHYVHQSNLAEERILLPLMNSVLGTYRGIFNSTAPTVHVTETQASRVLSNQAAWAAGQSQVEAYTLGNEVYVNKGAYTGEVPITVPNGTRVESATGALFGEAYAGGMSAWATMPATGSYRLVLVTAP